jgi:hypothetical protein
MAYEYDPVPDLAEMFAAVITYRADAHVYADRVASHLGLGEDDSAGTVAEVLRKALGLADDGGDPAGTVLDLRTQAPRTVFRDRGRLVIPAVRLDAAGCELLRKILAGSAPEPAAAHTEVPTPGVYYACCTHCEHNGESDPDLDDERHPNPCREGCRPVTAGQAARDV